VDNGAARGCCLLLIPLLGSSQLSRLFRLLLFISEFLVELGLQPSRCCLIFGHLFGCRRLSNDR
jgi:hypothetical protein